MFRGNRAARGPKRIARTRIGQSIGSNVNTNGRPTFKVASPVKPKVKSSVPAWALSSNPSNPSTSSSISSEKSHVRFDVPKTTEVDVVDNIHTMAPPEWVFDKASQRWVTKPASNPESDMPFSTHSPESDSVPNSGFSEEPFDDPVPSTHSTDGVVITDAADITDVVNVIDAADTVSDFSNKTEHEDKLSDVDTYKEDMDDDKHVVSSTVPSAQSVQATTTVIPTSFDSSDFVRRSDYLKLRERIGELESTVEKRKREYQIHHDILEDQMRIGMDTTQFFYAQVISEDNVIFYDSKPYNDEDNTLILGTKKGIASKEEWVRFSYPKVIVNNPETALNELWISAFVLDRNDQELGPTIKMLWCKYLTSSGTKYVKERYFGDAKLHPLSE